MTHASRSSILLAMHRAEISSPLGPVALTASAEGLVAIAWGAMRGGPDAVTVGACAHPVLASTAQQLGEYFRGERQRFDLPLDPRGTPFQLRVWAALRDVPFGVTTSYGALALRLGGANLARAVGAANGRNPLPIVVPCHRVVGSNGSLTGFAGGLAAKRWLLNHEAERSGGVLWAASGRGPA